MKTLPKLLCGALLGLTAATCHADPQGYFLSESGYRIDWLSNRLPLTHDHDADHRNTAKQVLNDLQTFRQGLGLQLPLLWNLFIRANGGYGWSWDGDFRAGGSRSDADGHTLDGTLVFGYNWCVLRDVTAIASSGSQRVPYGTPITSTGLWLTPYVGWGLDHISYRAEDITTVIDEGEQDFGDIKFRQQFDGPFVGGEILYEFLSCWNVTFGYDLHFAEWKYKRQFVTNPLDVKYRREDAIGHVVKLKGFYDASDCISIGAETKYTTYSGDRHKPRWRSFVTSLLLSMRY